MNEDSVLKRNGKYEPTSFDKILNRIKNLSKGELKVNYTSLSQKIIDRLYNKIPTTEIDELTAQQCASLSTTSPDYAILASRVLISNHHKNTSSNYFDIVSKMYKYTDIHGKSSPLISERFHYIVQENKDTIQNMFDYDRDFLIDYFGFKTLERAYLIKLNGKVLERPQHMWMRVAIGIHGNNMEKVKNTYDLMSQKYFTHATPTLFNAGTSRPQLSSCYLIAMESDSINGIYNTLSDCASISKWAGGIGMHIHNIRASGSHIRGTNGISNGIVPMLRVFNNTARYVDQCILPETYIYTTEGPMEIQNCEIGKTHIFNNKNGDNHEVIENILEHSYEGDILSIETMHSIEPLKITDEHPVFILKEQKGANYNVIKNRLNKNIIKPIWEDANKLTNNDFIIFNIPTYEQDIKNISNDDCYLYGIILGDGCMSNDNTTSYISLHKENKKHILDFLKVYFGQKCIRYSINDMDTNCVRFRWNKNIVLPFRYNDIYDNNKEKRLHHKYLNLPLNKSKYILKGLIDTDGCKNNELTFDTTSRNLIESLKYLCLRMGILTSGYIRDRRGQKHTTKYGKIIENKKIAYCLRIPKTNEISKLLDIKAGKFFKFFKHDNYLYSRIKNINKETYSGVLYDLQMKNTHNYMIHNGIIHNGGGRRKGSFAIYLEPWHADIEDFLDMKKNHGDEERRARDLFYALWIPDLFMERVKNNSNWTLMCPDKCPGLSDVYGDEFKALYIKYENENKGNKTVKARDIWFKMLDSQIETGTPYMLYKDACNIKSNQKNIGTIKSSNLCCEVTLYSDDKETAVCNLASIALSKFVNDDKTFNYDKLHNVTKIVTENLNNVIDINFYPTIKTKTSNMKHRPIGIGVQGLADTFALMDIPYHSNEAIVINKQIFETMYHAALEMSNELAKEHGPYSSFKNSPASNGILQFDMWGIEPSKRYEWDVLKLKIKKHGIRNSTLLAPMPTASTSQILGNNECFEPFTSNIYVRRTLAGEFVIVNKYLINELIALKLWDDTLKNKIIANSGSIQNIDIIPDNIKLKYKTVWEIPMRHILDMCGDRGPYICQSQSTNLWMKDPTYNKLTAMHFYAWGKGLKTGIYYLRTKAKAAPQQFTIEPDKNNNEQNDDDDECLMCGA